MFALIFTINSRLKKKWNCIIYCPGPDIPFGFNTLSFIALHILPIPIKNIFVSSDLNLPFTKDSAFTVLSLGWYKGLRKNRVALENENSSEKYSRNELIYNPYLIGNQLKGILPEDFLSQNPGLIADSGAMKLKQ